MMFAIACVIAWLLFGWCTVSYEYDNNPCTVRHYHARLFLYWPVFVLGMVCQSIRNWRAGWKW